VALGAREISAASVSIFIKKLNRVISDIAATRPTARNLFAALECLRTVAAAGKSPAVIVKALAAEAIKIHREEAAATARISRFGAGLIRSGWRY